MEANINVLIPVGCAIAIATLAWLFNRNKSVEKPKGNEEVDKIIQNMQQEIEKVWVFLNHHLISIVTERQFAATANVKQEKIKLYQ
jgi:hypothetical protein